MDLTTPCRVILENENCVKPRRAYAGDAGLDVALQADVLVQPGETRYVSAGVRFILPQGYCVHIMTRSSTFKRNVTVIPTVIDSGYTGVASVIVTNISSKPVQLHKGEYIAQAVLQRYFTFDSCDEQNFSMAMTRGDNAYGSSGIR